MADIAVVILNYNGRDFLSQFLPSVIQYSSEADVIVVDNASTDDSVNLLKSTFPEIELVEFKTNFGFTGGYNRALAKLPHKYAVLLNSDIEVTQDWLVPMYRLLESDEQIVACQPKVLAYHEKHSFEYAGAAGGFIDKLGYPYCRGRIFDTCEKDEGQYDAPIETFWSTGASLFIRTEEYNKAGGLDEDFFAHMEEIDLCWRLHLQGKKSYCTPSSVVYHVGGGTLSKTNPKKTYLNFRNNLSMILKNSSKRDLLWVLPIRLTLDIASAFLFLKNESFSHFTAVFKAHFDFIKMFRKNWKKRKSISRIGNTKIEYPISFIPFQYFIKGKKKFIDIKKGGF